MWDPESSMPEKVFNIKKATGPSSTKVEFIDPEDSQLRTDESMLDELLEDLDKIPSRDTGEEEQKEAIEPLPLGSSRTESLLLTPGDKTEREDDGLSPFSPPRSQDLKNEPTNSSDTPNSKQRRTSPMVARPGAAEVSSSGQETTIGSPSLSTRSDNASTKKKLAETEDQAIKNQARQTSQVTTKPGTVAVAGRRTSGPDDSVMEPQSDFPDSLPPFDKNAPSPIVIDKKRRTSPAVRPGAISIPGRKTSAEVEPRSNSSDSDQAVEGMKSPPPLAPGAVAVASGGGGAEEARNSTKYDNSGPRYVDNDEAPISSVAAREGAAKKSAKGSSSAVKQPGAVAVKSGAVAVKPGGREESTTSNISGWQLSYIDSEIAERSEDTSTTAALDREARRNAKGAAAAVQPGAVKSGTRRPSLKLGAMGARTSDAFEDLESNNKETTVASSKMGKSKAGGTTDAKGSGMAAPRADEPGVVARTGSGLSGTKFSSATSTASAASTGGTVGMAAPRADEPGVVARTGSGLTGTKFSSATSTASAASAGGAAGMAAPRADEPGVVARTGSRLTGTKFAAASSSTTSTGGAVGSYAVSQTKNAGSLKMALSADSILDSPASDYDEMKEEEDDTVADTIAVTPSESIAAFSWSSIMSDPEDGGDYVDPGSPTLRTSNSNRPELTRAVSAELVTGETFNEEEERKRIRKEAEKDAQRRLLNGAILATAEVIRDDEDEGLNKKLYCALACVVVIAIIVIVSVLAIRPDKKSPTSGPSFNNICETAFFANATGDVITGTISASAGTDNVTCQTAEEDGGFGLWYSLQGNGERLRASTCNGTGRDIDTQVLVLTGSCNTLLCVGGSDQVCGDQSSIGWLAEEDAEYFILVRGFRASNTGNFTLTVESLVDNGNCDDAFQIEEGGIPLIGSTRNLISEDSIETCSSAAAAETEAWYRLGGDGNIQCASVFTEDRSAQLSIFAGDNCSDLTCVAGLDNLAEEVTSISIEFTWITEVGSPYFLVVHGGDAEQSGDFLLDVHSPPANNLCTTAFDVPADGSVQAGTTIGACRGGTNQCGVNVEAAGVWYSVQGTGNRMVASTCNTKNNNNFVLQTFVLTGSCDDLECVIFDKEVCGAQSAVSWLSDRDTVYNLFVQGFNPRSNGDFELTVQEFNDGCETALPFAVNGEAIFGFTANATLDDAGICANTTSPGVWYVINGTGTDLTASACNSGTNFPADLTVFTGGCSNLECVDALVLSCNGRSSIAFWPSIAGQEYFILVHGVAESNEAAVGTFALTIKEGSLGVENDFCSTANQLSLPSRVVGSTIDASINDVDQCELTGTTATTATTAPGIWYTIVGTGTSVTASLCSDGTDFDTRMFVYEGSCGALVCVVADDDFCNKQSSATWDATDGLEYYILIGGHGSDVGNFELTVTPG